MFLDIINVLILVAESPLCGKGHDMVGEARTLEESKPHLYLPSSRPQSSKYQSGGLTDRENTLLRIPTRHHLSSGAL